MDGLVIGAFMTFFFAVPVYIGYRSAWATSNQRIIAAIFSFFIFAGLIGLGLWGLGGTIGKRRKARPAAQPTAVRAAAGPATWGVSK